MLCQFQAARVYNVKDMYEQSKDDSKPLLSNYGGTGSFWDGYKTNYSHFDRLFKKKYASLIPIDQDYEDGIASITDEFRADVYAWLLANDKRYTELFRVNSIPDNDAYSLTNNVDYTETTARDIIFDKGEQENEDDFETEYGQYVVEQDNELTYGATSGTQSKGVSAYNSSTYDPDEQTQSSTTQHIDNQNNDTTYNSHTDTNGGTHTEGARHDVTDEDVTVHKVGNMGVQTVDDMLKKHWENWDMFDFYGLIFEDIAKNLLRGC